MSAEERGGKRLGDAAWLLPRPSGADAPALLHALKHEAALADAVVTEDDVALYFRGDALEADARAILDRASTHAPVASAAPPKTIRVVYDGPDLDAVAAAAGLSIDEVVVRHESADYVVAMLGFVPGFAYLRGLDPRLHLPRRTAPRARVASGSVAIGGPYAGVYPFDSPGGWHLLGTAIDFAPFGLETGDHVRFVRARP